MHFYKIFQSEVKEDIQQGKDCLLQTLKREIEKKINLCSAGKFLSFTLILTDSCLKMKYNCAYDFLFVAQKY